MTKAKIVLVGAQHTGKTSIVSRYVYGDFTMHTISTTQPAFSQKKVTHKHKEISLEIWDTAGQERYHALSPLFYRDADAGIVVFDLTDAESFQRASKWTTELKKERGDDVFIVVAGNKCDLESARKIDKNEALKFAQGIKAPYFETSAKNNENIESLFNTILDNIADKITENSKGEKSLKGSIKFEEPGQQGGKCRC